MLICGAAGDFKPGQNQKRLVSPVFRIEPSFRMVRFKKIFHQPVRVNHCEVLRFQSQRAFKFCQALKFTTGKSAEEGDGGMALGLKSSAKKRTYQRRATSCNGQS